MPRNRRSSATFVVVATVTAGLLLAGPASANALPSRPHHPGAHAHQDRSGHVGDRGPLRAAALRHGEPVANRWHEPAAPATERRNDHGARHVGGNDGGIGAVLGQLVGSTNGLVKGVSQGLNGAVTQTGSLVGGLPGLTHSTPAPPPVPSAPPSSTPPHTASHPTTSGAAAPTAAHHSAQTATHDHLTTSHPQVVRAAPAPADMPELLGGSAPAANGTAPPTSSASAAPAAMPQVPVSSVALLAPRVWVVVLAIGLFALAVLFLVLGAGYRGGRRAR